MGKPLFGPAPLIPIVGRPEVDAAAIAVVFAAGDAVGDPAPLGAMTIIGMHIGHILLPEFVHKTDIVGVAAQYPGELPGSVGGQPIHRGAAGS